MRQFKVDVVSASALIAPGEVRRVTHALQKQVTHDLAPAWNVTADLRFAGPPSKARKGAWQLVLLDERDKQTVDGYHELTKHGLPLGRVMLRTAMQSKTGWTSTASHELLEMLVNPDCQLATFVSDHDVGARVYACEVCDPCQDDPFCYRIDGVWVSDFVHPAWFDGWVSPGSARFDQARKVTRPFKVAKGGYMSYYDARRRKWIEDDGRHVARKLEPTFGVAARGGSRKALREVPRHKWRRSER
jgi:hypothetical protein